MTLQQGLAFAVIGGAMALFIWGRWRYDLVAALALVAGLAVGIVPPDKAFAGFSDEVVIIVASALVVSAAVARSGVVEAALRVVGPVLTTPARQVFALSGAVAVLSAFVKNIGALAMLIPVAFQLSRRTGTSPSYLLMPMAFASLMGGLATLIGTSPNILVSRLRDELLGKPFTMFDFAPVGAGITVIGIIFLAFGYRLLPEGRKGTSSKDAAFNIEDYTTEARVAENSTIIGKTIADLEKLGEDEVDVATVIRGRRFAPAAHWELRPDDVLLLQGEPGALERLVAQAKLSLVGKEEAEDDGKKKDKEVKADDVGVVEAVVTGESPLIGRTTAEIRLTARYEITLLALSRRGERLATQLRDIRFQPGDVVVVQGDLDTLFDTLGELKCLPLAERDVALGQRKATLLPVAVLAVTMTLVALGVVPVAPGFFGAAVAVVLLGTIPLKDAYDAIEWPILILLGALIPVSEAIRTTGGTELIAGWLTTATNGLPPLGALALIIVAAMAVTPFLNNAATVLVMGPIAAALAQKLHLNPDPFLMAVALGAACDFLTPIGHQSNTLVMGPGGYHFGDYWKLGLPLSVMVVIVGTLLISLVWPLAHG